MKRILKNSFAIVLLLFLFVFAQPGHADGPPPPPPGGAHGSGGSQPPGGGAPVGEGAALLVFLAAGYGIQRVIISRQGYRNESDREHLFD